MDTALTRGRRSRALRAPARIYGAYGRVLLEAGVVKAAPGDELLPRGGPSDLSNYSGGNAAAADALCAALGG